MIQTITVRTCDLDGKKPRKAEKTTLIVFEGAEWELELCPKHERDLGKLKAEYVPYARKVANGRPARKPKARAGRADNRAIREWAKSQGITIADRGAIPHNVTAQYEARG